jgi:hypothetical protein
MSRGAEAATQAAADQERARQDAINQQLLDERTQARGQLMPEYQSMLAAPGYSEEEKAAITGQSLGALGSAFDALQNSAENRLARTGNTAGYGETLDELARERGRESSDIAQKNQIDFADQAFQRRMAALQGLGSLYGVDTGLLARGLNIPPELLGVRANASRGGGFSFGLGPLHIGG